MILLEQDVELNNLGNEDTCERGLSGGKEEWHVKIDVQGFEFGRDGYACVIWYAC